MKKFLIIFVSIFGVLFIGLGSLFIYKEYNNLEIANIKLINYNKEDNTITLKIEKVINVVNKSFSCHAKGLKDEITSLSSDGSCIITLPKEDNYEIYLSSDNNQKTEIIKLNDVLNEVLHFSFNDDKIYLIPEETKEIAYTDITIGKKINYEFVSSNDKIAKVVDNKIVGVSSGTVTITEKKSKSKLEVVVTDLITKPYAIKDKKEILACHAYTVDEAKLLDEILAYKVKEGGYLTRGGAVAAARFLTLEFAYRVPYFYENGRVPLSDGGTSNINTHIADGEGRYYKQGLYLSDDKKDLITASWRGPAIWGCDLKNLERNERYGYIMGKMMPNGLNCSGFVTWALKQAGFDPGDVGAGESPERDGQCTDLGKFVSLKSDIVDGLKVGDLLNWWGHIAMLIGIDEKTDTYYVAESLSYIGGVRAMIYSKNELLNTFTHAVLMDSYYQKEGNYQKFWDI